MADAEKPEIQFDRAEFTQGQPAEFTCGFCKQPLFGTYYQIGGQPACERCQAEARLAPSSDSGVGRFLRATLFGGAAAAGGSALWYAVRAGTGYEVGLIAVLVGLMVGGAVRVGCRGRGGFLYQALAVSLTYFGICAQYVPDIWEMLRKQTTVSAPNASGATAAPTSAPATPAPTAPPAAETGEPLSLPLPLLVLVALLFALAAPFLGGFQNILGILIIGFALWEAWKLNRRRSLEIAGPFRVGAPSNGDQP